MSDANKKILIAEDDPFLSGMYSEKLELENFNVILAVDGVEAIDKMKIYKPDLVLLDLLMPKKDGFEVLSEKLLDDSIKDIPVIVLTNLSQKEQIKKCYDLGAKDFLIKAYFVPSEVIKKIRTIIE
ncbi:MAG: response regulator [Patescibacteria group bacterium]|nr:response regulator [Patescibacteria group bacterium]MDD4304213.1 response regulator [Patescibacteria group bacterium]MDD4695246.1 response regulator [Patescibacteria group bacterium]